MFRQKGIKNAYLTYTKTESTTLKKFQDFWKLIPQYHNLPSLKKLQYLFISILELSPLYPYQFLKALFAATKATCYQWT